MEGIQSRSEFVAASERSEAIRKRAVTGRITRPERKEFARLREAMNSYIDAHGAMRSLETDMRQA